MHTAARVFIAVCPLQRENNIAVFLCRWFIPQNNLGFVIPLALERNYPTKCYAASLYPRSVQFFSVKKH